MRVPRPVYAGLNITKPQLLSATCSVKRRAFSSSPTLTTSNRIYTSVRHADEFSSILLLSSSTNQPLITLWTASWCRTCKTVAPFIRHLIESEGLGTSNGKSVGYVEVELDSPTIGDVPGRYLLNSVPTLLAFSRGEPQLDTRVTAVDKLKDRAFMAEWIEREAARGGAGGAGGSLFGGLFKGS